MMASSPEEQQPGLEVDYSATHRAGVDDGPYVVTPEGLMPDARYLAAHDKVLINASHPPTSPIISGADTSTGNPVERTDAVTHRSRRVIWVLVGVIAFLLAVAGVLGGVLGSRALTSSGGRDQVTTPVPGTATGAPTLSPTSPVPPLRSIRPNSGLAVSGFRTDQGVQVFVYYQGPDNNRLRYSQFDGRSWGQPVNFDGVQDAVAGTGLAAGVIVHHTMHDPQRELFYVDPTGRILGVAFAPFKPVEETDSIKEFNLTGLTSTRLGGTWPFVHFINDRGLITEVRNELIRGGDTFLHPTSTWGSRRVGNTPLSNSHIAVVPLSANFTVSQWPRGGGYGLFYQAGRALVLDWPDEWESTFLPIPAGQQSWPYKKQPPPPNFPLVELPEGAPLAAFATATRANDPNLLSDTYLLYQNTSEGAGGRISLMYLQGGATTWQTSSPPTLATADIGTHIACVTMPGAWINPRTNAPLHLEPASPEICRCFFQRGGKLVEVTFNGRDVSEPKELPIP